MGGSGVEKGKAMMTRALVTGGGGFLGSAIVKKLVAADIPVTSISRSTYPTLETFGVMQVKGDITNLQDVVRAARGCDIVFHTAAKPGVWGRYEDYHTVNVTGTENVITACFENNIKYLIHTSSPSVVFDGKDMEGADETAPYPAHYETHYPKTKALAERAVKQAAEKGLNAVILRPHLIWGPGDNHLTPRILKRAEKLARIGKAGKLVDTIYIDNAADAHVLAARALMNNPALSGNIYFISQGAPMPVWDMVNAILAAGGKEPVNRTVPVFIARLIGAAFEMVYKTFRIEAEPPMTRFVANELSTAHWFNISAARKDLGYKPAVSTREGLMRLADWLDGNPYGL